jgi:hypothetical protein
VNAPRSLEIDASCGSVRARKWAGISETRSRDSKKADGADTAGADILVRDSTHSLPSLVEAAPPARKGGQLKIFQSIRIMAASFLRGNRAKIASADCHVPSTDKVLTLLHLVESHLVAHLS